MLYQTIAKLLTCQKWKLLHLFRILDDNSKIFYYVGCVLSPFFCQPIILFFRVIETTPPFVHGTYFFRRQCINKVVHSFAQDDLERPDWSRYLKCCMNFKIHRLKQTTVDKSVHFVNFWLRNFKRQMKILKNYIWTYENGLHQGRYDSERGKSLNDPKDLYSLKYIFQFPP